MARARVFSFKTAPRLRAAVWIPVSADCILCKASVSAIFSNDAMSIPISTISRENSAASSRAMPMPTSRFCISAK